MSDKALRSYQMEGYVRDSYDTMIEGIIAICVVLYFLATYYLHAEFMTKDRWY